ncbi:hypothetical protein MAPG_03796, partial [Magnaporthiopsis poae ATCC 64411]
MESTLRVFDIQEKETGEAKAPSFPQIRSTTSGFPEHKKRTRVSAFKKQRQASGGENGGTAGEPRRNAPASVMSQSPGLPVSAGAGAASKPSLDSEKRTIDRENRQRLAAMSSAEIADAQADLLSSLDPNVLQMLLRRANLDEKPPGPDPFAMDNESSAAPAATKTAEPGDDAHPTKTQTEGAEGKTAEPQAPKKTVSFAATVEDEVPEPPPPPPQQQQKPDEAQSQQQEPPRTTTSTSTTHFPHATGPPELDPSDPDFLESLRQKYFPNLA